MNFMVFKPKIFVAGHRGLVGSALVRRLLARGHSPASLVLKSHAELDLTDTVATRDFFDRHKPDHVFVAAAKVGGIHANSTYPAAFVYQNLAIQTNVINEAWQHGVERLLFLGSSCIYPRECPQPIREEYLLTGPLEATNRPYAVAKIAGIEMCNSYNRQYGTRFLSVMPTNCFGPGDSYDLQNSHVLPALIRKMHEAKVADAKEVVVWGSGTPRREFIYSDDLADACVFLMFLPEQEYCKLLQPDESRFAPLINIGVGEDCSIRELAELVQQVIGFNGSIAWDTTKPDGTPRKLLDVSRLHHLGWRASTALTDGIAKAYEDFLGREGRS